MDKSLIACPRSIIPALDMRNLSKVREVVAATSDVPGIGAYKVGAIPTIRFGLETVIKVIRERSRLPVIYDHQKGGTDIPDLGPEFAKVISECGARAVILFPFGGEATEREWIESCHEAGLVVLVGGRMTQKQFLESEGGFVANSAPDRIYRIGAELGVHHFVVPGNKPELVLHYRELLEGLLGARQFTLYAPGFISQGGEITEAGEVAGASWHAIVGRVIYDQEGVSKIRAAAEKLTALIAA